MTTAQVLETSVTVNNNSPIQDYVHPEDQTQPTFEMTPGYKPFTVLTWSWLKTTVVTSKTTNTMVNTNRDIASSSVCEKAAFQI